MDALIPGGSFQRYQTDQNHQNNQFLLTRNVDILNYDKILVSVVTTTRELEVINNPELYLNEFLADIADANDYQIEKMFAWSKEHFKGRIPRNQIESIVDDKFRMKTKDHSDVRKKSNTKKSRLSAFKKLPKALQLQALSAVAPLTESLSFFSEDES